jgi:hypothetical protein
MRVQTVAGADVKYCYKIEASVVHADEFHSALSLWFSSFSSNPLPWPVSSVLSLL